MSEKEALPGPPPVQEANPGIVQRGREIFHLWETGEVSYQEALNQYGELRQKITGPADEAQIELELGIMQGYRGNYDASIEHFERSRELAIKISNRNLIARSALNIGETYRLKGNFTRARQYFQASYEAALAIGQKMLQIISRCNEAQMLISMGRYDQAETILLEFYKVSMEPWEDPETENTKKRRIQQVSDIAGALA
ncbi:MAG TPA: tetratricopeptide repeat protein, partial [Phototrophicaceae bacterium]|nr:tetratricopeptide repeat protein [Phototrophicaceae bacterium]